MARKRTSSTKRQRDYAKRRRQEEKAKRRAERKAAKETSTDSEVLEDEEVPAPPDTNGVLDDSSRIHEDSVNSEKQDDSSA